jgi:salicylate hydroxylase
MAPTKPFHIAVVGGGIGGLCTAIGLLHQGISVTIYESAPAFAEIGAGVSFGPNAVRAMSLIDPAIKAGYDKRATENAWDSKKNVWFDFRWGMKEGLMKELDLIASVKAGNVGQSSVHRAHFLDELVKLVPDEAAKFGKRLQSLEEKGGKMVLGFQDGTTAEADAVIGCDGVKACTRQILLGETDVTHPVFSGKYAYRGLIPMDKAVEAVGEELARNSQMYLGDHGHILTFPIEKGNTMNVVAFRTKDGDWDNEKWVLPMKQEDMFRDFEGWGEKAQHILSVSCIHLPGDSLLRRRKTNKNSQLMEKPDVWALFDHKPAPTYFKGRLCILGDSAHASTPHQGAGAGQAIEDAFVLSNLLGQAQTVEDLEPAFRAYDAIRRPRSQKVVTTSREAGRLYEFEDEELGRDLEKISKRLETRYDWIWEEDLHRQLKQAQELMGIKSNL